MPITRIDDLCPDGIRMVVPWKDMHVGESVFVPCVNTTAAIREANTIGKQIGMTFTTRVRVEDEKLGIRIWRSA